MVTPFLANVLRGGENNFNPFFLKNRDMAMRLLDAEKRGKVIAGLHLSAKMEELFGELTREDIEKAFWGKSVDWKMDTCICGEDHS